MPKSIRKERHRRWILLHREDYYRKQAWKSSDPEPELDGKLELVLAKNKSGATGIIPVHFEESQQLITDWFEPQPENPF